MEDIYTEIYEKLSTLQWILRRYQMSCQTECGPFSDTSRGQGRILAMLKIQPEIPTKQLAYLLGIRQQSLNELLNKLEKNGYVERKPSENDKRVMIVHLTEKGKNVKQLSSNYEEFFDCLNQEELENMSDYLDRIINTFQSKNIDTSDNVDDWMTQVRERMGNQNFEQLMSMRERAFGHRKMPKGKMPGAERFSEDYDGPIPDRGGFYPPNFDPRKK